MEAKVSEPIMDKVDGTRASSVATETETLATVDELRDSSKSVSTLQSTHSQKPRYYQHNKQSSPQSKLQYQHHNLTLRPLISLPLSELAMALVFDPAGRRLITAEQSNGLRFRSVTCSGDDMTACGHLDWKLWARAACLLPRGHLLVATQSCVQLHRSDGTQVAASCHLPGIVSLAVHERSAFALDSWNCCLRVLELPDLALRAFHPLHKVKPQEGRLPTDMTVVRDLLAITMKDDNMQVMEILTGRLRQSVSVSRCSGPKHLASCQNLGLLFVSSLAEHCISVYRLSGGMFDKAGSFTDLNWQPGPMAWLPVTRILYCASCHSNDAKRCELRSLALHESKRAHWTPKMIQMVGI